MRHPMAWMLTWLSVFTIAIQSPEPAIAQTPPVVTINDCRNLEDSEVRDRIRDLASTSLKTELSTIDYITLVNAYWAKVNVNSRIDREVDEAIKAVRANTSWFDRAYSTVSQSSASRYATAVADRSYNSEGFKSALDEMATGVAKEAGTQIEKATSKVSNPVINCVQTALQSRYGGAIAQVFAQESQKNINANNEATPVKIDSSDLLINNAASISGIVLVVTRRVIAKIVQSVGRRIAGVVASRIVSSVAGFVGLALIAKDIYDAGDGVFPIIADRMQSDETKNLIKDEIAKSIQTDIGQQINTIAQETADRIYAVWLDFKQKYNRLLALSEKSPVFSAFLKDRRFDQLNKLGQIVDLLYAIESEGKILERVANGSLGQALLDLNDDGLTVATELKSLDKAVQWSRLAGQDLSRVTNLGLYRWLSPDKLSNENLKKILSIDDKAAIARLANLSAEARDVLLNLPAVQMREFSRRLSDQQLSAFADYERRLEPGAARLLLRSVTEDPKIMQELSGAVLKQAIIESRDQLAALEVILHNEASLISYGRILKDVDLVRDGTVDYRVFWERYWPSILLFGFICLLFLSWLRRLIFGNKPTIVIRDSGGVGRK